MPCIIKKHLKAQIKNKRGNMKKFSAIIIFLLTIFSFTFFAGCEGPHANMKIEIKDGIQSLNLTLDNDNTELSKATLEIEVSGVKKNISKKVIVKADPAELAEVTELSFNDGITVVEIKALNIGTPTIKIQTVEGKKSLTVPVSITRKMKSFTVASDKVVFELPADRDMQNDDPVDFNISATVLRMSPQGATAVISWAKTTNYAGLNPNSVVIAGNKVSVPQNVQDGAYIELIPSAVGDSQGSQIVANGDKKSVKIYFIQKLEAKDILALSSSHGVGETKALPKQGLVLLANKGEKNASANQYYNQSEIRLARMVNGAVVPLDGEIFNSKCTFNEKLIRILPRGNNMYNIEALSTTNSNDNYIDFEIERTGFDGKELGSITFRLKYSVVRSPDAFELKMNNEDIQIENNTANVILYDVYANQLGVPFVFNLTPVDKNATYMQYYQLKIAPKFLAYHNQMFINADFSTALTSDNYDALFAGGTKNAFQLQMTYFGKNIKFYLTGNLTDGYMLVSEPLMREQTLMVKYKTLTEGTYSTESPTFVADNYIYSSSGNDYSYFEDINIYLTVNCQIKQGISAIKMNEIYMEEDEQGKKVIKTLANKVGEQNRYFMFSLIDANGLEITSLNTGITLSVFSNSSDLLTAQNINGTLNFSRITVYYNDHEEQYRRIYFKGNKVGNYTLTISHANGVKIEIKILIYDELEGASLEFDSSKPSSYVHSNTVQNPGILMDFDAAINSVLNFKVTPSPSTAIINDILYSYQTEVIGQPYVNADEYVTLQTYSGKLRPSIIIGNEGCPFLNGQKQFVIINIRVLSTTYDDNYNIIEKLPLDYAIKIFIYVPVQNIKLNTNIANVKSASSLSRYDIEKYSTLQLTAAITPKEAIPYLTTLVDLQTADLDELFYQGIIVDREGKLLWQHARGQYITGYLDKAGFYTFDLGANYSKGETTVYVRINQYGVNFDAKCDISITHATKVESIDLNNYLPSLADGLPYIYFDNRTGSQSSVQLQVDVKPKNSLNTNLVYVVTDRNNNVIKENAVVRISQSGLITSLREGRAVIWIFPQDCIISEMPNILNEGIDGMGLTFLSNVTDKITQKETKLYIKINVTVADGSYEMPYFVSTVNDLIKIGENSTSLDKHYALINDIVIPSDVNFAPIGFKNGQISAFTGSLRTYYDADSADSFQRFSILNMRIAGEYKAQNYVLSGLFANLKSVYGEQHSGVIENVNLNVTFNLSVSGKQLENHYIGALVAVNEGLINNCTVTIANSSVVNINLNQTYETVHFGALSGYNKGVYVTVNGQPEITGGIINYTDESLTGVQGTIQINSSNSFASIYAGGVAGTNDGFIKGAVSYYKFAEDGENPPLAITTAYQDAGSLSSLNLTVKGTYSASALGGIIGNNLASGRLINAYSSGQLSGIDNVGGLIGQNKGNALRIDSSVATTTTLPDIDFGQADVYTSFQHYDSYSSAKVAGRNNVGGVVGYDDAGSYFYVNAEYYSKSSEYDDTVAITGKNSVGGFVGKSLKGVFAYCFVISYKPNSNLNDFNFENYRADILIDDQDVSAAAFVGGFAGVFESAFALNCSSLMKIEANMLGRTGNSTKIYAGGFLGYANKTSYLQYVYSRGLISAVCEDVNKAPIFEIAGVFAGGNEFTRIEKVYTTLNYKLSANLSTSDRFSVYAINSATGVWDQAGYFNFALARIITGAGSDASNAAVLRDRNTYLHEGWDIAQMSGSLFNIKEGANHGYPYLLYPYRDIQTDLESSMSTEAPIEINISINEFNSANPLKSRAIDITKDDDKAVVLFMYDLIKLANGENIDSTNYTRDYESLNKIKLSDLITTNLNPPSYRTQRLIVSSDNNSVLEISNDSILLKNTGVATIRIYSALDPKKFDSIKIYVADALNFADNDAVLGSDAFNLYYTANTDDASLRIDNRTLQIKVGKGIILTNKFSDLIRTNSNNLYFYRANSNMGVRYEFIPNQNITGEQLQVLLSAIAIAGQHFSMSDGKYYIYVDANVIPSIEAFVKSELEINIEATPYIILNIDGETRRVILKDAMSQTIGGINELTKKFSILTLKGAESALLDVTDFSMSQFNEFDVLYTVKTDKGDGLSGEFLAENNFVLKIKKDNSDYTEVVNDYGYYRFDNLIIKVHNSTFDSANDEGKVTFTFTVDENVYIDNISKYTLQFIIDEQITTLNVNVVLQEILRLRATNYVLKENGENTYIETNSDKIQPGIDGLIKIDVTPQYANYDFIEITNVNASNMISFKQVYRSYESTSEIARYLTLGSQDVSLPNGIRLFRQTTKDNANELDLNNKFVPTYYILTLISSSVPTGTTFEIDIIPYKLVNGKKTPVDGATTISVVVQNLPTVNLNYINPRGTVMQKSSDSVFDLAINTKARINVSYDNIDAGGISVDNFEVKLYQSENTSVVLPNAIILENGQFYLNLTNLDSSYLNKKIVVTCQVRQTSNNDVKIATDSISFSLKQAVIHGVSFKNVYNSVMTVAYGETHELIAYFDKNDISFNSGTGYNDIVYDMNFEYNADNIFIKNILQEINRATEVNQDLTQIKYYTQKIFNKQERTIPLSQSIDGISFVLQDGKFKFTTTNTQSNNSLIKLNFEYYYSLGKPVLYVEGQEVTTKISNEFTLSVVAPTSLYSALPIYDAEGFLRMEAGRHYILLKDIELNNYVPLDIELGSFDGNGYEIKIKNFDLSKLLGEDNIYTQVELGLFARIYPDMIVQNVVLKVPGQTIDFTNVMNASGQKLYASTIKYGSITATNEGVITNCIVMADINGLNKNLQYVTLDTVTSRLATRDYALKFNFELLSGGSAPTVSIAGLVETNSGYITNCKVMTGIYSYGNLAGVAINNSGVISSTKFIGGQIQYNYQLGTALPVAGFILNNNGRISMSYIEGIRTNVTENAENDQLRSTLSGIESSGEAAGFVYVNNANGKITNCYSDISINSSGVISGFVFNNNKGTIDRCFTSSKLKVSEFYAPMIATNLLGKPNNTGTFTNCYYLKGSKNWPETQGLALDKTTIKNKTNFNGFIFDDTQTAIWYYRSFNNSLKPTLTSANMETNPTKKIAGSSIDEITGETIYTYVGESTNTLGSALNPYILYNTDSWNLYMSANNAKSSHFRMVADINMQEASGNPTSSGLNFVGRFEGNDMQINNLMLYTAESLNYIGLFGEIGAHNLSQNSFVRNLTINNARVNASKVKAVGILAGIITSANVYNITINSPSATILGQNAVGGLAGLIRGNFNIDNISSSVGANSGYRFITRSQFNMYERSFKDGKITDNLSIVSYAGAVAGIVDGYTTGSENVNNDVRNYKTIGNIEVKNNIIIIGENVGSAFGLVGENTLAYNIVHTLQPATKLKGAFVSGGLVGENRGLLSSSKFKYNDAITQALNSLADGDSDEYIQGINNTCFAGDARVAGGVVGINNGGIIYNCQTNVNVINAGGRTVAGGLVGRNINGAAANSTSSGFVLAKIAGGLVGTHTDPNFYVTDYDVTTAGLRVLRLNLISSANFSVTNLDQVLQLHRIAKSTDNNNLKSYLNILTAYTNCNVQNINWQTKYFKNIMSITSSLEETDIIIPNYALGAIMGATELNTDAEIIPLFKDIRYNNLYKHGITFEYESIYKDGYYPLKPVALRLYGMDNWSTSNGYNGLSALNYILEDATGLSHIIAKTTADLKYTISSAAEFSITEQVSNFTGFAADGSEHIISMPKGTLLQFEIKSGTQINIELNGTAVPYVLDLEGNYIYNTKVFMLNNETILQISD